MRWKVVPILILLFALVLPVAAEESVTLDKKAIKAVKDFNYRPERNFTFSIAADRTKAYRQVQTLLLEQDYMLTAQAVHRGDQLGPFVSKCRFCQSKLAEAVMVRLKLLDEGTQVTIRGVFVVPGSNYLLDRSDRKPTTSVRRFAQLYAAKLQLIAVTGEQNTHDILARAKDNLAQRRDLEETIATLQLVEDCTHSRSMAGRQAREISHAIRGEIKKQKLLHDAVAGQQAKIDAASAGRDWLAVHQGADKLLHILLEGGVSGDDPRATEARDTLRKTRRTLRRRGALIAFAPQLAPAQENDVAVGFTALNVGNRPIAAFKVRVDSTDAAGKPSPGRIGRAYPYTVELDPPLAPDEYYQTAIVLRFETSSNVEAARLRVVGVTYGKLAR